MNHQEFKEQFDQAFAKPLCENGFSLVGRGKTLQFQNGNRELRIIRQGGRAERPGIWRSVICFRHTFLRPINSDDPNQQSLSVSDFSRKLVFQDFDGWRQTVLNYRPENSGRWKIHDFHYANSETHNVRMRLQELTKIVEKRVLPWARTLTEKNELEQIRKHGEQAWCERRWIKDYEDFLINKS